MNACRSDCPSGTYYDPGIRTCKSSDQSQSNYQYQPPPSGSYSPQSNYQYQPPQGSYYPPPPPPPPSGQGCPSDSYWDGHECRNRYSSSGGSQPAEGCPPEHQWNGRYCEYKGSGGEGERYEFARPPAEGCPPSSYWDGRGCVQQQSGQGNWTPPPRCGPEEYWDYKDQQCRSHSEYRPPSCPEGSSYCQPGGQEGDGRFRPAPGCDPSDPNAYCPPPPRASCRPGDTYCRPPADQECGSKLESIRPELESVFKAFGERMNSFQASFEADRSSFAKAKHSPEEWKVWGESWRKNGEAIGKAFQEEFRAFVESRDLGPCMQYLPPPPFAGHMGGPGGPPGGDDRFAREPPPDSRHYDEYKRVGDLRSQCEEGLRGGPDEDYGFDRRNSSLEGEEAPRAGASKEKFRECEREIRKHYEEFYEEEAKSDEFEDEFGSFQMVMSEDGAEVVGKYTQLSGDPNSQMIGPVLCGGVEVLERMFANGYLDDFSFEDTKEGTALQVSAGGGTVFSIHDNPRCTINFATTSTVKQITLDFDEDVWDLEKASNGYRFTDGDLEGKILVHSGKLKEGEDGELVLKGKATLLLSKSHATKASRSDLASDEDFADALEDGNIGAEVVVALDKEDEVKVATTEYAGLEIAVELEEDDSVSATIDAEQHDGKTVVFAFDGDIFDTTNLDVGVIEIEEDEDGEPKETELDCVQEAKNLEDVLDPTNDGECHEYWAVQDKLGVHLLVSFPHFSTKKVTIQSVGTSVVGPIPGFDLALWALAVLGAVTVVAIRTRRQG